MKNVVKSLEKFLANNYALYLKTQSYHWNVKGAHFLSLHGFFEEMYTDLASVNDRIAERIRALGYDVDATFSAFNAQSLISGAKASLSSDQMLEDLLHDNEKMKEILVDAIKDAENAKDLVTVDFFIERMASHEKTIWILRSLRG